MATMRLSDRLSIQQDTPVPASGRLGLSGHLRVLSAEGSLLTEAHNMVVNAGLQVIVDAMQSASTCSGFKYVAFGLTSAATAATDTTLGTEVTGGSYARLTATQGEGDNAREYRLSGTWTNNSGATRRIVEYGIFRSSTVGTMLCRTAKSDTGGPSAVTCNNGATIGITWDLQTADA